MKTLLTLTVIAAMMLLGSSAMATYFEDFEDGLAQNWTFFSQTSSGLVDVAGGMVVPQGGSLTLQVPAEGGVWASEGTVNQFGAGTYNVDVDFNASYANSIARLFFMSDSVAAPIPTAGFDLYFGVFGGTYIHGFAGGATVLVNIPWAAPDCPFNGGGGKFNIQMDVSADMKVSLSVYQYATGLTKTPAAMQNVDVSLFTAGGPGFMGSFAHNYASKWLDNVSFVPIPEPTVGLLGLAALAFIRRRK